MAVMKYLGSDGLYHVLPAYVSSQVQSVNGKLESLNLVITIFIIYLKN